MRGRRVAVPVQRRYAKTKFGRMSVEITKDGFSVRGVVNVSYHVPCSFPKAMKNMAEADDGLLAKWLEEDYVEQLKSELLGVSRAVVGWKG